MQFYKCSISYSFINFIRFKKIFETINEKQVPEKRLLSLNNHLSLVPPSFSPSKIK